MKQCLRRAKLNLSIVKLITDDASQVASTYLNFTVSTYNCSCDSYD